MPGGRVFRASYANIPAMACPYFYPQERFDEKTWMKHPRLPLGDPYTGVCCVDPMREWRPDMATVRDLCNQGYARQRCTRFPKDAGPDARRFSVITDDENVLKIFYVSERDHAPLDHGDLEFSTSTEQIVSGPDNAMLKQQAVAYVRSYLRRKHQPEEAAKNPHRR